jgi:hypothetical protein
MTYAGYTLVAQEFLRFALRVLVIGTAAGLACWAAGHGVCAAWAKARLASRRWRAERALRSEVTRGLAQIEVFLDACWPRPR